MLAKQAMKKGVNYPSTLGLRIAKEGISAARVRFRGFKRFEIIIELFENFIIMH